LKTTEEVVRDFLQRMPAALALVRAIEYKVLAPLDYPDPTADLGCGDGFMGEYLFAHRNQTIDVGVEINPIQAEKARSAGAYGEVVTCSASDLPYPDGHFRTIFSNCVFEHIPNLVEVFMEIRRTLHPEGKYIFTAHSHYYSEYLFTVKCLRKLRLGGLANTYIRLLNAIFHHFNCIKPEYWEAKLNKAGLELVHHEYYLGPKVLSVFDRLLPLSIPSFFWYKFFKRYTLFPRGLAQLVFHRYLCRLVDLDMKEPTGGGLLLVAKRKTE
jgi:SAM-dependent methyltransferase